MKSLQQLERNIENTLEIIQDLQHRIKTLVKENKELAALVTEKEIRIDGLQKQIEDLKAHSDQELLEKYKDNEKELKKRIQSMLIRLDNLEI